MSMNDDGRDEVSLPADESRRTTALIATSRLPVMPAGDLANRVLQVSLDSASYPVKRPFEPTSSRCILSKISNKVVSPS